MDRILVERAAAEDPNEKRKRWLDLAANPALAESEKALAGPAPVTPADPSASGLGAVLGRQGGLRTEADVQREQAEARERQRTAQADPRNAGERHAFARALVTRAANTAAAPVTLAARGLRAAGVPGLDAVADLDANEAYADAESLIRDEAVAQTRDRHRVTADANPLSNDVGGLVGDIAGGFGAGASRGVAAGALRKTADFAKAIAPSIASAAATAQEMGYRSGAGVSDSDLALAAAAGGAGGLLPRALSPSVLRRFEGIGSATEQAAKAGEFLKKHKLSGALKRYIGSDYDDLNRELREGKPSAKSALLAADLGVLLNDAKRAGHAVQGTVYRGLTLPKEVAQEWVEKGAIKNRSFWSTTGKPSVADDFRSLNSKKEGEQVVLELETKSGVPVGRAFAGGSAEDEVLMNSGTNWVITKHERTPDGVLKIYAREVDAMPEGQPYAISFDQNTAPGVGTVFSRSIRGAQAQSSRDDTEDPDEAKRSRGARGSDSRKNAGSR